MALALLVAAACGGDDDEGFVALDGTARLPDVSGVVTALDDEFETITIDGKRYDLHERPQSFSTIDGSTQPLKSRVGQYVHAGQHDGEITWVAGIAAVVDAKDGEIVIYTGRLAEVEGSDLIFEDGTVLEADEDLGAAEEVGRRVIATIDVESDRVTALERG